MSVFTLKKIAVAAALSSLSFMSPGLAQAKTDPAKEKANLAAAFKKLVDKVDAAKKAGPFTASACMSAADDFVGFGKSNKSAEGYFNAGVLYEQCGDAKKADQSYRDALSVNPSFAPAHVNIGEMLYKNGNTGGAQGEFDTALRLDPKNVQAYNDVALMTFEKARQGTDKAAYSEAIGKLRRALAIDSDSIQAYSLLALIYFQLAESDRAKLDLAALVCKQAKEVNDKYAPIYNTLGLINLKRKNVTGALKEFRTAAELDPRYIEAQLNIGAITLSVRDYTSAEKAFKAVLDAQPRIPAQVFDATMGMGVALRGQRRVDEAEQWYSKAKALDPKACAVTYNLGVLYQDYKNSEDNSHLNKSKQLFADFLSCGRGTADKVDDAKRRMKDIDDTFKAIAEAKKMEEEGKKLQAEADAMQKQADEQACAYWKTQVDEARKKNQPPPPPPTDKCPGAPPAAAPGPGGAAPAPNAPAPAAAPAPAPTGAAPAAKPAPVAAPAGKK